MELETIPQWTDMAKDIRRNVRQWKKHHCIDDYFVHDDIELVEIFAKPHFFEFYVITVDERYIIHCYYQSYTGEIHAKLSKDNPKLAQKFLGEFVVDDILDFIRKMVEAYKDGIGL